MRLRLAAALLLPLLAWPAAGRGEEPAPVAATPPGPAALPAPPPCRLVPLDALGDADDDLMRLAELTGAAPVSSQLIRRAGHRLAPLCAPPGAAPGWLDRLAAAASAATEPAGPVLELLPVRAQLVWNSAYPSGDDDGLLWAGRGLSTQARLGVAGRWGVFSAALAPEVAWQQNDWFRTVDTGLPGAGAFRDPWYAGQLDAPQRFGAGPFATAALGQSFVRADAFGATVGLSTENLWLGPGLRDALLLTDNAPGFPHLVLGTSGPADIGIGALEVQAVWGRLDRSRYAATRDQRWFSSLAVTFQPRWVPGLFVGLGRTFIEPLGSLQAHRWLSILQGPLKHQVGGDNLSDNQEASAWFRWVVPEGRLELYGEWGRDDFPRSFAGLVRDPRPTSAWVWGAQKLLPAGARLVRVQVEMAGLYDPRPAPLNTSWYAHGQGSDETNQGQLLGAPIGPGGDRQWLAVDLLGTEGRGGAYLERAGRNELVYWTAIQPLPRTGHDVELTLGWRQVAFAWDAEVSLDASAAWRWNRDFVKNQPDLRLAAAVRWPVGGAAAR